MTRQQLWKLLRTLFLLFGLVVVPAVPPAMAAPQDTALVEPNVSAKPAQQGIQSCTVSATSGGNVRDEPNSTTSSVIVKLNKGAPVTSYVKDGDWHAVKYGPKKVGFMHTSLLACSNVASGSGVGGASANKITNNVACLTDVQAGALLGLTKAGIMAVRVGTAPGQWVWQASSQIVGGKPVTVDVSLPNSDWSITARYPDGSIYVYYGPVDLKGITGFTLWQVSCAPQDHRLRYPLRHLSHEQHYTLANPERGQAFWTYNGNIDAPACPKTREAVATIVGGRADQWHAPDWDGGAWVFRPGKDVWTQLKPDEGASLDFWGGSAPTTLFADGTATVTVDEASYHCHRDVKKPS